MCTLELSFKQHAVSNCCVSRSDHALSLHGVSNGAFPAPCAFTVQIAEQDRANSQLDALLASRRAAALTAARNAAAVQRGPQSAAAFSGGASSSPAAASAEQAVSSASGREANSRASPGASGGTSHASQTSGEQRPGLNMRAAPRGQPLGGGATPQQVRSPQLCAPAADPACPAHE